jgi:hypothetical protein
LSLSACYYLIALAHSRYALEKYCYSIVLKAIGRVDGLVTSDEEVVRGAQANNACWILGKLGEARSRIKMIAAANKEVDSTSKRGRR